MSFIKSLFAKKSNKQFLASPGFANDVRRAIGLIGQHSGALEDREIIEMLQKNGIPKQEAIEILIFLPIAFVQHLMPAVNWPGSYIEYFGKKNQVEIKYADSNAYTIIWQVTKDYFNGTPDADVIIKIGDRSAEFHALNDLLTESPGANLAKIEVSKTFVVR